MHRHLVRLVAAAALAAPLALFAPAIASASVVYDAIPNPLAPNYPSQPFQAQQVNEFGDSVHLGGTDRQLTTINVTMSDWAVAATPANQTFCAANASNCDSTGFNWPITVNVYSTHLGANGAPDTLLATKTVTQHIPWRPADDLANCPNDSAWFSGGTCYHGYASTISFDLSDQNVTLPDDVIVTFVYNTQTYGPNPTGVDGPYNSLNIAIPNSNPVTVGNDNDVDGGFWNTNTVGWYHNPNCHGGTLCQDTGWSPNGTVAMQINAITPPVAMCPSGTQMASTPLETVVVNSNASSPVMTLNNLASGISYILKASGAWQNSNLNAADAEYASVDNWSTHMQGYNITPYFLGASEFDLEVDNGFVDWGAYNAGHMYSYLYTGTGSPASFVVFDGDSNQGPSAINAGWYGDNTGTLSVDVYPCLPPPKVVIAKYVDGAHATAQNANSAAFPMWTSWTSTGPNGNNPGVGFTLSPSPWGGIGDPYEATYVNGQIGDNYNTNEVTTGNDVVGSSCADGKPFALVGYTTGSSWAEAQQATPTLTSPSFTNLQSDEYVIVWNKTCPQLGSISGMKFNDLNRNGKKDPNEPGLQGWTIRLEDAATDAVIATTTTDADGNYTFANLQPGTYEVREVHQKGWKRISKNPKDIVISAGSVVTGVYFGNAQKTKGEREDTDKDDQRNDQSGKYYGGNGQSNYDRDQNNKGHSERHDN